jgi:type III secretion protein S
MSQEIIVYLTSQAMQLVLYLSLPVLVAATVVGLVVSLFQALTSIQEQTLPHAFKLVAVMLAIAFTVRVLGTELYDFAINVFNEFPHLPK